MRQKELLDKPIISINDNIVTEHGALAIGKSLESCTNLASLDIGDCLIRNKARVMQKILIGPGPSKYYLEKAFFDFDEI